jgi:ATP-dependent Clp protease protease subunit
MPLTTRRSAAASLGRLKRRIAELTAEHTGQSVEQISTDFAPRDRWFTAPEAVAYGLADEVIGGPAGAPESGTSA